MLQLLFVLNPFNINDQWVGVQAVVWQQHLWPLFPTLVSFLSFSPWVFSNGNIFGRLAVKMNKNARNSIDKMDIDAHFYHYLQGYPTWG